MAEQKVADQVHRAGLEKEVEAMRQQLNALAAPVSGPASREPSSERPASVPARDVEEIRRKLDVLASRVTAATSHAAPTLWDLAKGLLLPTNAQPQTRAAPGTPANPGAGNSPGPAAATSPAERKNPKVELAAEEAEIARHKRSVEIYRQQTEGYDSHYRSTTWVFITVHLILVFGVVAAGVEFRRANRLAGRSSAVATVQSQAASAESPPTPLAAASPAPATPLVSEIQLGLQSIALKTALHGLLIFFMAFGFYLAYLRWVYPLSEEAPPPSERGATHPASGR
jgi:hypothetical protein